MKMMKSVGDIQSAKKARNTRKFSRVFKKHSKIFEGNKKFSCISIHENLQIFESFEKFSRVLKKYSKIFKNFRGF